MYLIVEDDDVQTEWVETIKEILHKHDNQMMIMYWLKENKTPEIKRPNSHNIKLCLHLLQNYSYSIVILFALDSFSLN